MDTCHEPRWDRILVLVSAHNGLSQRAWVALTDLGHEVAVAVVGSDAEMEAAVLQHRPELIVCPFLRRMIPEAIWSRYRCLIVHPGPIGDRGPWSLDWAIELGAREWGVTVLEANGEFDAGRVWATRTFPMREVGKSSLYRREVRHAAIEALVEAIGLIANGGCPPLELRGRVVAGGAAPGGVPLALAGDCVVAREDIVLNPYYQHMGGLYGSEYWTYLLPRRVGHPIAARLTSPPFTPLGARQAVRIGLLDAVVDTSLRDFHDQTRALAERLAGGPDLPQRLEHKRRRREHDEREKPLDAYRREELARCHDCFFGPDPSYHEARRRFVYKLGPAAPEHPALRAA